MKTGEHASYGRTENDPGIQIQGIYVLIFMLDWIFMFMLYRASLIYDDTKSFSFELLSHFQTYLLPVTETNKPQPGASQSL